MNIADDKFNVSKVESYLYSILSGVVSDHTYVGTLPDTIDSTWEDMCLIDCSASLMDEDARATGIVFIALFARPNSDGSKNVPKMSAMEVALNEVIRNAQDTHYSISRRSTYTDYDSNRNWHFNTVELNIVIFN